MEEMDAIRREDKVLVTVWGPSGNCLYKSTNDGYHSLENAIQDTLSKSDIGINPEDCVFEVSNLSTGISHRYRLNAHGNIKLII